MRTTVLLTLTLLLTGCGPSAEQQLYLEELTQLDKQLCLTENYLNDHLPQILKRSEKYPGQVRLQKLNAERRTEQQAKRQGMLATILPKASIPTLIDRRTRWLERFDQLWKEIDQHELEGPTGE